MSQSISTIAISGLTNRIIRTFPEQMLSLNIGPENIGGSPTDMLAAPIRKVRGRRKDQRERVCVMLVPGLKKLLKHGVDSAFLLSSPECP